MPPGPIEKRFASTYLVSTVRPATEEAFALVIAHVSTAAMRVFLAEFAATIAPGRCVLMVLGQASRHGGKALIVASNITLGPLLPYGPDLNLVERICFAYASDSFNTGCWPVYTPSWAPAATLGMCSRRSQTAFDASPKSHNCNPSMLRRSDTKGQFRSTQP